MRKMLLGLAAFVVVGIVVAGLVTCLVATIITILILVVLGTIARLCGKQLFKLGAVEVYIERKEECIVLESNAVALSEALKNVRDALSQWQQFRADLPPGTSAEVFAKLDKVHSAVQQRITQLERLLGTTNETLKATRHEYEQSVAQLRELALETSDGRQQHPIV